MRKVSRSALVQYTAGEMFALVDDVESYPKFLPWCTDARVLMREPNQVEASLELTRGALRKSFVTQNTMRQDESIDLELVKGPFRQLAGGWQFRPLTGDACKVSLDLHFEFENRLTDMMLGPFFEEICNKMVDAFTSRAAAVYGRR